jgi:hypothetical protein
VFVRRVCDYVFQTAIKLANIGDDQFAALHASRIFLSGVGTAASRVISENPGRSVVRKVALLQFFCSAAQNFRKERVKDNNL